MTIARRSGWLYGLRRTRAPEDPLWAGCHLVHSSRSHGSRSRLETQACFDSMTGHGNVVYHVPWQFLLLYALSISSFPVTFSVFTQPISRPTELNLGYKESARVLGHRRHADTHSYPEIPATIQALAEWGVDDYWPWFHTTMTI